MIADPFNGIADILESDIWHHVASDPPGVMVLKDAVALATQLKISGHYTKTYGTAPKQAAEFVVQTDNLLTHIEAFGGFRRVGGSMLAATYFEASQIADALLDAMAAGSA
jgi:hypothetical protein